LLRRDLLASTAAVLTLPPSAGTCKKSWTIFNCEIRHQTGVHCCKKIEISSRLNHGSDPNTNAIS
jgi:hypothetical protein